MFIILRAQKGFLFLKHIRNTTSSYASAIKNIFENYFLRKVFIINNPDTNMFLSYIINTFSCKLIKIHQSFQHIFLSNTKLLEGCQEISDFQQKSFTINNLHILTSNSFAFYQMQYLIQEKRSIFVRNKIINLMLGTR